jgi:hypothetical protein
MIEKVCLVINALAVIISLCSIIISYKTVRLMKLYEKITDKGDSNDKLA